MKITIKHSTQGFSTEEAAEYHRELARAEARIRKNILRTHSHRNFNETLKFGVTAAVIFVFVFGAMNVGAYSKQAAFWLQKARAKVLENAGVEVIVEPAMDKLEVREVAQAETERGSTLPTLSLEVAPPDNRLVIPSLDIHAPIHEAQDIDIQKNNWQAIEDQVQEALKNGVVHFPGTATPGKQGNAFITGHSSYYPIMPGRYKDVFALLPEIEIGAVIEIWQDQKKLTYQVSDKREVNPSETNVLDQTDDQRLTLMTCTPLGTALKRLIVTAQLEG